MFTFQFHHFCLLLLTFTVDTSLGCRRLLSPAPAVATPDIRVALQSEIYMCGICGQPITVTLIVRNVLQPPTFEYQVTVEAKPQRELIYFIEQAAITDPHFKFTAQYYGSLGYMVTTINGVAASTADKTYWSIVQHHNGNLTVLGLSNYVPVDFETILFNLTTWN